MAPAQQVEATESVTAAVQALHRAVSLLTRPKNHAPEHSEVACRDTTSAWEFRMERTADQVLLTLGPVGKRG